ncbi:L,D-transpeptidase family protein [Microbacterium sp. 4R-513]|uniref:L,D-transpeptidase family protein n=1 Tax=Microbacterium sp. 4R-513 TaxID=2567934 RepID=UPI0013E11062|nr:L,D-transpeptidase family protein [Microbacterium sp. 4R-513]QIG38442.1 L,D-transpeptidase family protein [Microbacterium sp. 4R-513]
MTDLATRPDANDSSPDDGTAIIDDVTTQSDDSGETPPTTYEWAPTEPAPKKRHLGLWIGIPVAAVAIGVGVTSLFLIAPGTSIAGVPVGGLTPGAAAEAVQQQLATTTIVLTGPGGDAEVTAAELGATIDAKALADEAFAQHPAWNPTTWNATPAEVEVTLDPATATEALRAAVPSMYVDPTDATIGFDPASATYVVTPAVDGQGIDVASVEGALTDAFASGDTNIDLAAATAPVPAEGTTAVAEATAGQLNGMLDSAGFYVGDERTVPIDRATFASWLTVTPADRGTFTISADPNAIQPTVDGLAAAVNRAPVDSTTIVNAAGRVLSTPTAGAVGRELGATDGIAKAFADQIGAGNAVYALPVTEVPFHTTSLARMLEVDLSEQRLYVKENGNVVDSWLISSGANNTPTYTGHYNIGYKATVQTMNGYNRDAAGNITGTYSTPNVKWPMYFNGGQAFHGVYWHNNYGHTMSHGCVGMPEWRAQWIYNWAPSGTDVWIHN